MSAPAPRRRRIWLWNSRCGRSKASGHDIHLHAFADGVVKLDDVAGRHADAPVAGGAPEFALFGGAMDVDIPSISTGVAGLAAAQAENAGHDRIAAGSVHRDDLAG